ncbi:MAG TPA: 3-deoxy-manno-octulosonate cytidylyltransferase [Saprospiraceae bacterium]|nr:3-deoxy-manno-octulosonate cytidylyltransferase [Saprospiraceae bacterium]
MKIIGIIPARLGSSRLPEKVLADIGGKSMIQRVYEQTKLAQNLDEVWIATDSERVFDHCKAFCTTVAMSSLSHQSGTDRCAELASALDTDWVINIQGDEPFIIPVQIDQLAEFILQNPEIQIATQYQKIKSSEELFNPSVVKLVKASDHRVLYFSRSAIPYVRNSEPSQWFSTHEYYRHVGMYAYRKNTLLEISQLKSSPLELVESLEQLRWLENSFSIFACETSESNFGIDTIEDLEKARDYSKNL